MAAARRNYSEGGIILENDNAGEMVIVLAKECRKYYIHSHQHGDQSRRRAQAQTTRLVSNGLRGYSMSDYHAKLYTESQVKLLLVGVFNSPLTCGVLLI